MVKFAQLVLPAALAAGVLLLSAEPLHAREFSEAEKNHWAFQPVKNVAVPAQPSASSPIDAFISAKLATHNLKLNPPAGKATLIRRASLDLTGLPPTPGEVKAFLEDSSPNAFEQVIDRLLRSPHYGEKQARHWLDLARYAESEGFKADETRPNIWRYRDYVINSFNQDKPYDRFVSEQIAGDELWPGNPDALVATGFNRHYPDESNARNLMQRRQEILNDITDTVGAVFIGLTISCARCHDHKFDPVLQADYYRLQAFFANAAADDNLPLLPKSKLAEYKKQLAVWENATKDIREKIAIIEASKRRELIDDYVTKYPAEIQAALNKSADQRSPFECQMVAKAELYINPASHQYIASSKIVATRLKGDDKERWELLNKELQKFDHLHPGELPIASGVVDISGEAPKTFLLARGTWDTPRQEIQPGFLAVLNKTIVPPIKVPVENSTGRRAALARLITDPLNPLTSRVMANRVWQQHFGKGLVETSSDFGMKGSSPTHPELLDWLAQEFVRSGWSIKKLHKTIMLSAAYQQTTTFREECAQVDPANQYLWRFPRQRLQGEIIRDAALAVSGLLNPEIGGPSVFPELPTGLDTRGGWDTNQKAEERNRRSIYVFVRRNMRYPMFESFDMPDTHESCSRRNVTTSPLQALTMLNNKVTLEWAQSFAARLLRESGTNRIDQVRLAYLLAFGREANRKQIDDAAFFFDAQKAVVAEREANNEQVALPSSGHEQIERTEAVALVDFCHALLNSNEFVYQN